MGCRGNGFAAASVSGCQVDTWIRETEVAAEE